MTELPEDYVELIKPDPGVYEFKVNGYHFKRYHSFNPTKDQVEMAIFSSHLKDPMLRVRVDYKISTERYETLVQEWDSDEKYQLFLMSLVLNDLAERNEQHNWKYDGSDVHLS